MPQFCSIIVSQWENPDGRLVSAVYGLSTEGQVYKFAGKGWVKLPHRLINEEDNGYDR